MQEQGLLLYMNNNNEENQQDNIQSSNDMHFKPYTDSIRTTQDSSDNLTIQTNGQNFPTKKTKTTLFLSLMILIISHVLLFNQVPLNNLKAEQNDPENNKNINETQLLLLIIISIGLNSFFTHHFWKSLESQNSPKLEKIINFLCGPISFILDIWCLILQQNLSIMAAIFRIMKFFTLPFLVKCLKNIKNTIPQIGPLFIALFSVFYLFTYIATFMYGNLFKNDEETNNDTYFVSLGYSTFTMLQIMTLDGWGEIGRSILSNWNMLSALFLCLFIFIMSYFFMNILVGFILEISRKQKQEQQQNNLQQQQQQQQSQQTQLQENKQMQEGQFPSLYNDKWPQMDYVIIVLQLVCIINSFCLDDLSEIKSFFSIFLNTICSLVYALHYYYIKKQQQEQLIQSYENKWIHFFNIVSGPLSLLFDIYSIVFFQYISHGAYLKIFKLFTLKIMKGIILGAIKIFPLLVPPFTAILGIIFVLSMWGQMYIGHIDKYWINFNNSVYTFFQILTLDDWCANLIKILMKRDHMESPLIFIGFIFIANFFFLNIMISISCEQFQEIKEDLQIRSDDLEEDQDSDKFFKYPKKQSEKFKLTTPPQKQFDKFIQEILKLSPSNKHSRFKDKLENYLEEQISEQIEEEHESEENQQFAKDILKQKNIDPEQTITIQKGDQIANIPLDTIYLDPIIYSKLNFIEEEDNNNNIINNEN